MTTIQSKIEAELLKLKSENAIIIGKKIVPDVAKRLADLFGVPDLIAAQEPQSVLELKGREDPNRVHLSVLEKIKERIGSIPVWRIPEGEYLAIVEECRKAQ